MTYCDWLFLLIPREKQEKVTDCFGDWSREVLIYHKVYKGFFLLFNLNLKIKGKRATCCGCSCGSSFRVEVLGFQDYRLGYLFGSGFRDSN